MSKVIIIPKRYPCQCLVATCGLCGKEILQVPYDGYTDYGRARRVAEKAGCNCVKKIKWERKDGDWIAYAKDGDFLVWKWGCGYKARYRKYGGEPEMIGSIAFGSANAAKIACERHRKWKL